MSSDIIALETAGFSEAANFLRTREERTIDIGLPVIPGDVRSAADKVSNWASAQGWKDWKIHGVADRHYTEKLERDYARAMKSLQEIRDMLRK